MPRTYDKIADSSKAIAGDRTAIMQEVVDSLWDALHSTGVSWVGFYLFQGSEELILGPSRDKPACSPIGMHGACGQAFKSREPLVVQDVQELSDDYIARDLRARSEGLVPGFERVVSGGAGAGVGPGGRVGSWAGERGVDGSRFGRIEIRDTFSLVEVGKSVAEKVIKAVNGITIRGRSTRVDYDRGGRASRQTGPSRGRKSPPGD